VSQPEPTPVARGTAYGLVADATTVVSALVVGVIVARFLGPEKRGVYVLAVLAAWLISLVGDLGVSTSGLVFAADRRMPLSRLHGLALGLSLAVTAVGGVLLLGLGDWLTRVVLKGVTRGELWLVVAGILPTLYAQLMSALLTGLGRIGALSVARIAAAVVAPVAMLAAVWASGGSAFWAVVGWLVGVLALALPLAGLGARELGAPAPPSRRQARSVLGFGLRAYVGTLSHHGFLRLDVLFLSIKRGPADDGQYSLASVLAERISLVGSALYGGSAAHVGAGDRAAAEELVARMVRLLLMALLPVALLLGLTAHWFIPLVFGADFRPAVEPFVILLPGTVALTLWYVLGLHIIAALHRPTLTTAIQGGALLASLPLYWAAISAWGMTGAAIVSSAVYASVALAGVLVFQRHQTSSTARLLPRRADVRDIRRLASSTFDRIGRRARHA
jgi:O-antigen/teichoic acid export membrane protein